MLRDRFMSNPCVQAGGGWVQAADSPAAVTRPCLGRPFLVLGQHVSDSVTVTMEM